MAGSKTRVQSEFPGASAYRDRHDVRRWRYRVKGFAAELGRDYGSPEFRRRYEAALQRKKPDAGARMKHGSLNWLIVSWYRSPGFRGLAGQTRQVYRNIVERLREAHGDKMVAKLRRGHISRLVAAKADTPAAANRLASLLKLLLDHAVEEELRDDNPAAGFKKFATEGDGFHTWTEAEIARFEAAYPIGTTARLAFTLMLYTGAARVDACAMGWHNLSDGRIAYRRRKTLRTTGILVDIPVHPSLAAVLREAPRDRPTFLETRQRRARSPDGLGNMMRDWCDAIGLPQCTSHGLRKACATRLAEAGCSSPEIAAITGHASLKMVEHYTRAANRKLLASSAMARLCEGPASASSGEPIPAVRQGEA